MLIDILKEQGFSERESKIYLACLALDSASVSNIARYSKEKRVTVYTLLKELMKKGVAKETVKNKMKYYSVITPEDIIHQQEQKIQKLKDSLPEFLTLMNSNIHKTKIYFYEGMEGIKKIYDEILLTQTKEGKNDPILSFLGTIDMDKHFQEWLVSDFLPRDIKHKKSRITPKVIIFDEYTPYAKLNKKYYETLVISNSPWDVANEIIIYGDKVAILMYTTNEMSGLIIESKNINHTLRNLFDLIWKVYKK